MTTENVMKLGKLERLSFSFVHFLSTLTVWIECKQTILPLYRIIKNQFELNGEKCIKNAHVRAENSYRVISNFTLAVIRVKHSQIAISKWACSIISKVALNVKSSHWESSFWGHAELLKFYMKHTFKDRFSHDMAQLPSHMSHVTRKPVFGVSDQVRLKPGCIASEAS